MQVCDVGTWWWSVTLGNFSSEGGDEAEKGRRAHAQRLQPPCALHPHAVPLEKWRRSGCGCRVLGSRSQGSGFKGFSV